MSLNQASHGNRFKFLCLFREHKNPAIDRLIMQHRGGGLKRFVPFMVMVESSTFGQYELMLLSYFGQ
ncbi:hypothetical protein LT40_09310 [Pseudomonas rhizosphaerae]|uniref:Uncharacterized protein n=1 Tax=Pseudomonas rhizosphaerae TaxID=216142 RepID=A0A089YT65_9PSED|nr:hypothetical protein LT40_09310 [Pseudomonas rhizosphaerae]